MPTTTSMIGSQEQSDDIAMVVLVDLLELASRAFHF